MTRLALIFLCFAAVASAQEVRITRSAMLRSDRTIISLRAGTIVDVLGRDGDKLTVRFNQHTGTIPASSLDTAPAADAKPTVAATAPVAVPAKKSGSSYVNAVNKTKETTAAHGQNNASQVNDVLAAN